MTHPTHKEGNTPMTPEEIEDLWEYAIWADGVVSWNVTMEEAQKVINQAKRGAELYALIEGLEPPDSTSVSCLGPSTLEGAFLSGAEQIIDHLKAEAKKIKEQTPPLNKRSR